MEQNVAGIAAIFVVGAIVSGFIFQKSEGDGAGGIAVALVVLALGGVGLGVGGKYAVGLMLVGPLIVALVGALSYVAWVVHREKNAKEREVRRNRNEMLIEQAEEENRRWEDENARNAKLSKTPTSPDNSKNTRP